MSYQKVKLYDAHNRLIGYVEIDDRGDKKLYDGYNHYKGKYEKKSDKVYDAYNRLVGKGDILTSLL